MTRAASLFILYSLGIFSSVAYAEELCMYTNAKGAFVQVVGRDSVPADLRAKANCFTSSVSKPNHAIGNTSIPSTNSGVKTKAAIDAATMALPSDVTLDGNLRRESLDSALGRIELRWPRSVEPLFGASPERAVINAANVVNKTLRQERFTDRLRTLDLDWQIVIIDQAMSEQEIPAPLRMNCHPGWMTPPANIYLVAQRIAGNCEGKTSPPAKLSDDTLEEVLLHEFGHVIEFYLLDKQMTLDRMRAEGFATWFATLAAQYAKHTGRSTREREVLQAAKVAIQASPASFIFQGTAHDYARAALFFLAVEKSKGVPGVLAMYQLFAGGSATLVDAAASVLRVSKNELINKMNTLAGFSAEK
jgi:hypothetical protein